MKRFLRDAAVALFVGAVLVALAMFLKQPADEGPVGYRSEARPGGDGAVGRF